MKFSLSVKQNERKGWLQFILWILLINWALFLAGCGNEKITQLDGLQVPEGFTIDRVVSTDMISYQSKNLGENR